MWLKIQAMAKRHVKRLLVIGWDAADWGMLDPLIAAGKMPALQRLLNDGVRGNLATIRPVLSPMLWNSMATGKRADKHGITGFVEPMPDATGIRPVASTSRTCKAAWNILSQNGMQSVVINWFASHPAEPIKGKVVTDRYEHAATIPIAERQVPEGAFHPPELAGALWDLVVSPEMLDGDALAPFLKNGSKIDQDADDRVAKLAHLVSKTSTVHAAACHSARDPEWDLMAVYYGAIDQFGHYFMPYHPPAMKGIAPKDAETYGGVMEACYRFHDMMLASLLQYAGPDTTVMLVSDHGFHHAEGRPSTDGMDNPVGWHRPFGVACMSGPGIQNGKTLHGGTILDVTPTILTALGIPVGMDMDGRAWAEVFAEPEPVEKIMSWEMIEGDDGMHAQDVREDPAVAAEVIRQLVDLGYMEAPDEDVQQRVAATLRAQKMNLALALTDSRRSDRAIPLWEALLEADPVNPDRYLIQLALCCMKAGDLSACEAHLGRVSQANQTHREVLLMKARAQSGQGRLAESLEILLQIEAQAPGRPEIAQALGDVYLGLGDPDQAHQFYTRARRSDDLAAVALDGLSRVALYKGDADLAVEYSLEAVALIHYFPEAHLQMAQALALAGRTADARVAAAVALQLEPDLKAAHRLLAELGGSESATNLKPWMHDIMG